MLLLSAGFRVMSAWKVGSQMLKQKQTIILAPIAALLAAISLISIVQTGSESIGVAVLDSDTIAKSGDSYPARACSINPAGNERTVEFLNWARRKHPLYANVELDDHGDITRLDIEVCYDVQDDELNVIGNLPRLRELVFFSANVTDAGLESLEVARSLQTLIIRGTSRERVTPQGVQRLQKANPTLKIHLNHNAYIETR